MVTVPKATVNRVFKETRSYSVFIARDTNNCYADEAAAIIDRALKAVGYTVKPYVVNVDTLDDGEMVAEYLKQLTGYTELPIIFLCGECVGGLQEIKKLESQRRISVDAWYDIYNG